MTILWINLAVVFAFAWTARYFSAPATGGGTLAISPNRLMTALAALSLILVAGLRNNIGDTFFYMHSYEQTNFDWNYVVGQKDIGFNLFQMLLKQLSGDPQILVLSTALITNVLVVAVMYHYARMFELSMFVYITSGAFIVSMNGIRQYMAAAIVLAATKFLLEGRWKSYMSVVLIASIFHQSALVMIPIYFIVRRKAWTGTTFALLVVAILIVAGFNQFSELLFTALKDTQYGEYESFSEGGANIIRVLINAAPLFILYVGRERLREIFPKGDILVNLSLIGCILMIISTQNWIFARMAIYFNLYQIMLLGWMIRLFREKDRKLVYYGIMLLYLVFFFYENVITLDLHYTSPYLDGLL